MDPKPTVEEVKTILAAIRGHEVTKQTELERGSTGTDEDDEEPPSPHARTALFSADFENRVVTLVAERFVADDRSAPIVTVAELEPLCDRETIDQMTRDVSASEGDQLNARPEMFAAIAAAIEVMMKALCAFLVEEHAGGSDPYGEIEKTVAAARTVAAENAALPLEAAEWYDAFVAERYSPVERHAWWRRRADLMMSGVEDPAIRKVVMEPGVLQVAMEHHAPVEEIRTMVLSAMDEELPDYIAKAYRCADALAAAEAARLWPPSSSAS